MKARIWCSAFRLYQSLYCCIRCYFLNELFELGFAGVALDSSHIAKLRDIVPLFENNGVQMLAMHQISSIVVFGLGALIRAISASRSSAGR